MSNPRPRPDPSSKTHLGTGDISVTQCPITTHVNEREETMVDRNRTKNGFSVAFPYCKGPYTELCPFGFLIPKLIQRRRCDDLAHIAQWQERARHVQSLKRCSHRE